MWKITCTQCIVVMALSSSLTLADEWKKTFTVSGRADLRVDATDGEVTVRSWDRNEIEARITTQGWKIGSDARISDHQAGDRVEIDVRTPRLEIGFLHRSLHVELEVPRELRAEIHTGDGRIVAQGLKGEIHLSTGDGALEVTSMDGILEARTGDGHIRASGRWDKLELRTNDGSIEAEVHSGSKMAGGWRVHSGDGHVTLRLPSDFAADIDAHTGDGKVTVDLPVTLSGVLGGSQVRGKLNGGGETLTVRTGDGPIRLEQL